MFVCYDCLSPEEPEKEFVQYCRNYTYSPQYLTVYCGECGGVNFVDIPEEDSVVISILKAFHEHATGKRTLKVERIVKGKRLEVIPHPADAWLNVKDFVESLDLTPEEKDFYESLPDPNVTLPDIREYPVSVKFCANCGSPFVYELEAPLIENIHNTKVLTDTVYAKVFCKECGSYNIVEALLPESTLPLLKKLEPSKAVTLALTILFEEGKIPLKLIYQHEYTKTSLFLDPRTELPIEFDEVVAKEAKEVVYLLRQAIL